jgi:aspartate aminotransferase/aminotransferase
VPVHIPYWENVYDFEKYITNRTRLIIINNPNNPRGNVFSLDELVHLYRLAEKYNLFILSDEAYSDFVEGKDRFISLGNIDRQKKHSIICNSISKNFGISGWRIGYIISNPSLIHQMLKLNQHLITCPATILEYYVAMYFDEILRHTKPQISALNKKRAEIQAYMDGIGLSYLPGSSTFYFFVSISSTLLDSDTFCMRFLNEHNICVVPGIGYGISCDKFVRVSIGAEPLAVIKPALTKLKEFILQTSKNNDK